ncbi:MAG: tetratricopeptide repeat protein [Bacteroidota bacterium]
MKIFKYLLLIIVIAILYSCNQKPSKIDDNKSIISNKESFIIGKWLRMGHNGPISLIFKENGTVDSYLDNNNLIDVLSDFSIINDTIKFYDKQGKTCPEVGVYKIHKTDYYIAFDLIDDNCNGRVKSTMGFWIRPNFEHLIKELDSTINASNDIENLLNRARIYMALGKSEMARNDFDTYIQNDTTNARVFMNRAATKFPNDFAGAIVDCNKSIAIDPNNKSAYFLRGIALFETGEKEKACDDLYKAIELGFSILKEAEKERCNEFWDNYDKN